MEALIAGGKEGEKRATGWRCRIKNFHRNMGRKIGQTLNWRRTRKILSVEGKNEKDLIPIQGLQEDPRSITQIPA